MYTPPPGTYIPLTPHPPESEEQAKERISKITRTHDSRGRELPPGLRTISTRSPMTDKDFQQKLDEKLDENLEVPASSREVWCFLI